MGGPPEGIKKRPDGGAGVQVWGGPQGLGRRSTEADLAEDALAGEQFGAEADHEAEHGQPAIPGFSKGHKAKTG